MAELLKHQRRGSIADAFRIIWPLMLSNSVTAVMQFTDRIFLSRYSDIAMQAAVPAGTLSYLLLCVMHVTVAYSGTFVAQYHGAGRRLSCARAFFQSFWLFPLTAALTLLLIPLGNCLIGHSGHPQDVLPAEKTYFTIMMLCGLLLPIAGAMSGYLSGRGFTRIVMWISIVGTIINIPLDLIMIYGCRPLGIPEWGVAGAAWATAISQMIIVLIYGVIIFREPIFRGARRSAALAFDYKLTCAIVRYGLPSGLHILLDMLTFTFFIFVTGREDIVTQMEFAASNVCFNINHLVYAPLIGIGIGAGILVGNYQGAKDSDSAYRAGWSSIIIGWIFMGFLLLMLGIFLNDAIGVFLPKETSFDKAQFISLSRILVLILASWCMFDVVNVIAGGALKGAGDTKFVMYSCVLMGFLLWVPMILFVVKFCPSIVNLWLTLPLYVFLLAALLLHRWCRGRWRSIDLISNKEVKL